MPCDFFDYTVHRLENNDPSLASVTITRFSHPNPADWETLGNALASNSSLRNISFYTGFVEPAAINEQLFELLCEGLLRNTSINEVDFINVHNPSNLGTLFQCLAPFLAKREVEYILIHCCDFDSSSCTLIGGVLARCTFLRKIAFDRYPFDEEMSVEIIKSLGWMTSLESIRIYDSGKWTGWDYLINHLRFSNHTLKSIEYEGGLPQDLITLLNMNNVEDKNALAIRKGSYFNFLVRKFDAKPYGDIEEELKPKLLPHILTTVSGGENGDGRSEEHRLSALFHYVKSTAREVTTFVSD